MDLESYKQPPSQRVDEFNNSLTYEELTQLRTAEDDLRRAEAAYEALAHLRRKRTLLWRSKRIRRRKKPTAEELKARELLAEEHIRERNQRRKEKAQTDAFLYSIQQNHGVTSSPEDLVTLFKQIGSLDKFAKEIGTTRRSAIRLLKSAGLDVIEYIAKNWDEGESLRVLSSTHGPTPQTISKWIKSTGRRIKPRNGNQKHDLSTMAELFSKKWTTNKIAKTMGLSWATVQKARVAS
jgi:hypothetical protein